MEVSSNVCESNSEQLLNMIEQFLSENQLIRSFQTLKSQRKQKNKTIRVQMMTKKLQKIKSQKNNQQELNENMTENQSITQKTEQETNQKEQGCQIQINRQINKLGVEEQNEINKMELKQEQSMDNNKEIQIKYGKLVNQGYPTSQSIQYILNQNHNILQILRKIKQKSVPQPPQIIPEVKQAKISKLQQIIKSFQGKPANNKEPIPNIYVGSINIPSKIKSLNLDKPYTCFVTDVQDLVSLCDLKNQKIICNWRKNAVRIITAVCNITQNQFYIGLDDGTLINLSYRNNRLEPYHHYEKKQLHQKCKISGLCVFNGLLYSSGFNDKLNIIETKTNTIKHTKICIPLQNLLKLQDKVFQHIIFGIDCFKERVIMFDEKYQLKSTIFMMKSATVSQITAFKNQILVGVSQKNPSVYKVNPKTGSITQIITLKTLEIRPIAFTLLNKSNNMALVIGTSRIYYHSTKTWKVIHKKKSHQPKTKFHHILASCQDMLTVADDKSYLQIYKNGGIHYEIRQNS